jgi:hypothetical protein
MSVCANCGYDTTPGDVFCAGCGTSQPAPGVRGSPGQDSRRATAAGFAGTPTVTAGAGFGSPAGETRAHAEPGQTLGGAGAAATGDEPPGRDQEAQQPHFAGTNGVAPAPNAPQPRAGETIEQKYMRQTRNATVFIAVIVAIFTTIALIGAIITAVNVAKLNSQLNNFNGSGSTSNCVSQGGTNPDC